MLRNNTLVAPSPETVDVDGLQAIELETLELETLDEKALDAAALDIESESLDEAPEKSFCRNRLTWLGYIMHGYWSYVWAAFGAFVPFLRSEFNVDYSTAALHFSALALGPFMAGFIGDRVIHKLGLTKTISCGQAVVLTGLALELFGWNPVFTIGGAWLIGFGGSLMGQSINTSMAARFGEQRAIGFTELQIFGTLSSLMAPLTVCAIAKAGFGWRTALMVSVSLIFAVILTNINTIKSYGRAPQSTASTAATNLSSTYWLYFGVIFFSVASEWTVAFWSPEFVANVCHLPKEEAAIGMSAFLFAMLSGRILGVTVLKKLDSSLLLIASAWLAALGFIVFWTSRELYLCVGGLLLMGLGEANVYPLCFARAIAAVVGAPGKAAARMSVSTGGAILLAPLFLGMLADKLGICQSYGIVAVFLITAAVAISFVRKKSNAPVVVH